MNLIYGTYNPSKLESMKKILYGLDFNITGLGSFNRKFEEAAETGKAPLENAVQKAMLYFEQIRKPVFSCDTGLYFEDVDECDQPGVFIKRIHGNNLSYRQMLDYYSRLASKYGGKLLAYYRNSICLVMDEKNIYKYSGADICSEKFYIVEKPHKKYREGFPLDSLSVETQSMKYYYDLDENINKNIYTADGFRRFFINSLKEYAVIQCK